MTTLATASFLSHLKSIYPNNGIRNGNIINPWYIVAAVAFSASNRPDAVPHVFQYAMKDLQMEGHLGTNSLEGERLLARKLRDALFKSGLTSGYPRAINSLVALSEVMPEELRDTKTMRRTETPITEYEKTGRALFHNIYGDTADSVQSLLDGAYPDMGWFSNTIGYGLTYGFTEVLSPLETSYTLVAALIAGDTPRQIGWHLDGARRGGATFEEVQAVRRISMEVASSAGVKWKDDVPEVKDAIS
ncbi:AhpD-like protein [Collybia nuda]|uniref:AhpD-like protein n=1 Tax=Collybia nuda TaxID=64659 RepID=A0A9P5Y9T1_9AGAR|nr:AhpD-like protein [Collybia nuda]